MKKPLPWNSFPRDPFWKKMDARYESMLGGLASELSAKNEAWKREKARLEINSLINSKFAINMRNQFEMMARIEKEAAHREKTEAIKKELEKYFESQRSPKSCESCNASYQWQCQKRNCHNHSGHEFGTKRS
jgi:hypothetical protein